MVESNLDYFKKCIQDHIDGARAFYARRKFRFTERDFDTHTIGDLIETIMYISDEDSARAFHEGYVEWMHSLPDDQKSDMFTIEEVAQQNIGWCFGLDMAPHHIAMWKRICDAYHPIGELSMRNIGECIGRVWVRNQVSK